MDSVSQRVFSQILRNECYSSRFCPRFLLWLVRYVWGEPPVIRPAGKPVAGGTSARVVKLARVARTIPAVVFNPVPLRMTVTHDKVQSPRMPRGAGGVSCTSRVFSDILAICLGEVVFRFLAKDNRGGGAYHATSPEYCVSVTVFVGARVDRIHEVRVRRRGHHGRVGRAGTRPDALHARRWGCIGGVQITKFRLFDVRRKNIVPCGRVGRIAETRGEGAIVGVVTPDRKRTRLN